MTLKNKRAPLLCYFATLCITSYPLVNSNWIPETPNLGQIWQFLELCDLEIWRMTLKNNRTPLLCYFKLCASFGSHWWIKTGDTVRKRSIRVKIGDFFVPHDLEIWRTTLKNYRAPLLCCFKLCASFHSHQWIQTGVTVQKCQFGSKSLIFCVARTSSLADDLEKQKGTSSMLLQALCTISKPLVN